MLSLFFSLSCFAFPSLTFAFALSLSLLACLSIFLASSRLSSLAPALLTLKSPGETPHTAHRYLHHTSSFTTSIHNCTISFLDIYLHE
ncbi:hypothetical protein BDY24DRAFT_389633 [Mrakia frigida]|uniref:uncharacterized protein n=1 Tax=Mrakia frigida TaxID=29902 RepID=UPI003FCC17AE